MACVVFLFVFYNLHCHSLMFQLSVLAGFSCSYMRFYALSRPATHEAHLPPAVRVRLFSENVVCFASKENTPKDGSSDGGKVAFLLLHCPEFSECENTSCCGFVVTGAHLRSASACFSGYLLSVCFVWLKGWSGWPKLIEKGRDGKTEKRKKWDPTKITFNHNARQQYLNKLCMISNIDPYDLAVHDWITDLDTSPPLTYPDILNYLLMLP